MPVWGAGLDDALGDPDLSCTMFAPSNDAIMASRSEIGAWRFDNSQLQRAILGQIVPGKRTVESFSETTVSGVGFPAAPGHVV